MTVRELLAALPQMAALVVGDVCLDRWCTYDGSLSEPSRETGIPRTAVIATEVTPGAAGTVANNLAALGVGRVAVMGVLGDDGFGVELARGLARRNISSELCVRAAGMQTFTYTKLINAQTGIEDQPRVDFIHTSPLAAEIERRLLDNLQMAVESYDAILISDQAETSQGGVVTAAMRELLRELACVYRDRVFFVDSRARIELFRGVVLKPNRQEAETACSKLFGRLDYTALRQHTESPLMLVTHGGDGVLIARPEGDTWIRARRVDPVDICGAGDSFSAGCAMALAANATPEEAARFGNLVASVTIMKKGTGTASPEEVLAADEDSGD
jgi:rfaE bifunctional protein kinase chain/domain